MCVSALIAKCIKGDVFYEYIMFHKRLKTNFDSSFLITLYKIGGNISLLKDQPLFLQTNVYSITQSCKMSVYVKCRYISNLIYVALNANILSRLQCSPVPHLQQHTQVATYNLFIHGNISFFLLLHVPSSSFALRRYLYYLDSIHLLCFSAVSAVPQKHPHFLFSLCPEQEGVIYLINSQFCSAARCCVRVL